MAGKGTVAFILGVIMAVAVCVAACPQTSNLAYSLFAGAISLLVVSVACTWACRCYERHSMVAFHLVVLVLSQLNSAAFALLHQHVLHCCSSEAYPHFADVMVHMVPPAVTGRWVLTKLKATWCL